MSQMGLKAWPSAPAWGRSLRAGGMMAADEAVAIVDVCGRIAGMLSIVAGMSIVMAGMLIILAAQAATMKHQRDMESDTGYRKTLEAMRAEQSWLVGQGLAQATWIGPLGSLRELPKARGAFESSYSSVGGWALDASWDELIGWGPWASRGWGIDPGWKEGGSAPGGFSEDVARSYRHEEGHVRIRSGHLKAGSPEAWPKGVGEALAPWMGLASDHLPSVGEASAGSWRMMWLAKMRDEAFADAFSCLSAARKGRRAVSDCALGLHALRIFPSKGLGEGVPSMAVAGDAHAVESASFLAAQLDGADVARLDSKGLDELAGHVADAALAWQLSKIALTNGFFEGSGRAWWMGMAARAGQEPKQAAADWEAWSAQALEDRPKAAFGSFEWQVAGIGFKARGLQGEQAGPCWRYDGYCGIRAFTDWVEPSNNWSGTAAASLESLGRPSGDPWMDSPKRKEAVAAAEQSALMAHRSLAMSVGADMEGEARRLMGLLEDDLSYANQAEMCMEHGQCKTRQGRGAMERAAVSK